LFFGGRARESEQIQEMDKERKGWLLACIAAHLSPLMASEMPQLGRDFVFDRPLGSEEGQPWQVGKEGEQVYFHLLIDCRLEFLRSWSGAICGSSPFTEKYLRAQDAEYLARKEIMEDGYSLFEPICRSVVMKVN
jgi:hypothetical protein